jgi:hypothetical protein
MKHPIYREVLAYCAGDISDMTVSLTKSEKARTDSDLCVSCRRCGDNIERAKSGNISYRGESMIFCDRCFKSVFKYDPSMRTVDQIWNDNGRKTPFVVRSSNWHRSSYMLVKEAKSTEGSKGKTKTVYVGDFYLRGELKEQNHVVGKANHFIWTPWSTELAEKYKEPVTQVERVELTQEA